MVHMRISIHYTKIQNIRTTQINHGRDFVEMQIGTISVQNNGKFGVWSSMKKVI